jgi:hypothetical protein
MDIDNPHIRRSLECPLCGNSKSTGLVVCWPCFRQHDMSNGNPMAEQVIAERERLIRSLVNEGSLR